MVPSSPPVDGPIGSGFGFRTDPFTHRPALHTGLDFPADPGTAILAAAGGAHRPAAGGGDQVGDGVLFGHLQRPYSAGSAENPITAFTTDLFLPHCYENTILSSRES